VAARRVGDVDEAVDVGMRAGVLGRTRRDEATSLWPGPAISEMRLMDRPARSAMHLDHLPCWSCAMGSSVVTMT
jgi:hypothetical protein